MKFSDNEHREFWNQMYKEMKVFKKQNVYYKSIIYVLGICKTTRDNFSNIFNFKDGEININSLNAPYQTSTSAKVTRMAFSLWNGCNYDSEKDIESDTPSSNYNVGEIFNCNYAPFFYEGIKIRYPEYTKEKNYDKEL